MPLYAVKMKMQSPMHIGEVGLGMEEALTFVHSDTLYSAIYSAWVDLYEHEGELPILITSGFPYVGDMFFLPKPGLTPPGFDRADVRDTYTKRVKSAQFVDVDTFEKWVSGQMVDYEAFCRALDRLSEAVAYRLRPRVTLDRVTNDSSLYHIGEVLFRRDLDAGLYFAVECAESDWETLKAAVRHLGERGIGGERSAGYGRFEPEFVEEFSLHGSPSGSRYVALSLVLPKNPEEAAKALSYTLVRRGGWTGDVRQKTVYLFGEGSVFSDRVEGRVCDVAGRGLPHPVYRNGRAFLVTAR